MEELHALGNNEMPATNEGHTFIPTPNPTAPPMECYRSVNATYVYGITDGHAVHDYAPPEYPVNLSTASPNTYYLTEKDNEANPPPAYDIVMENTDAFKVTEK